MTESTGLVFVLIPGGTFTMGAVKPSASHPAGSPNVDPNANFEEGPLQTVSLDPFFMSKYEMTQGQWQRFTGNNPSKLQPGAQTGHHVVDLRHPVEGMRTEDCRRTLAELGLVLPTEAQWEYCCRAGTTTPFNTGSRSESLLGFANVPGQECYQARAQGHRLEAWDDGYPDHAPVGSFRPNDFGLFDTHGNVFECCRDEMGSYELPARPGDGLRVHWRPGSMVFRGGSYLHPASWARSAFRRDAILRASAGFIGVRPAAPIQGLRH